MTNFKPTDYGIDFYHCSFVALLDEQQMIRGFYNILIPDKAERLKEAIKRLLK
jgi:protein SCO1/2